MEHLHTLQFYVSDVYPMYSRKEAKSVAYERESALCYPTNISPGYRSFDSVAIRGWRLMSYDSAYFWLRTSVPYSVRAHSSTKRHFVRLVTIGNACHSGHTVKFSSNTVKKG